MKESYWPVNVPREETLLAFRKAFETLGYVICETPDLEENYQKIAIYLLNGQPTHVARQLLNGKWTSKLGQDEDIEHDSLEGLTRDWYGQVAQIMKRKLLLMGDRPNHTNKNYYNTIRGRGPLDGAQELSAIAILLVGLSVLNTQPKWKRTQPKERNPTSPTT